MSDWRVFVLSNKRLIRQKYWVRLGAANGKILMHSEQYKNLNDARELGHQLASALDANFIDLTG